MGSGNTALGSNPATTVDKDLSFGDSNGLPHGIVVRIRRDRIYTAFRIVPGIQ